MWKRGRNGIIYKVHSHWNESCSKLHQTKTFHVFSWSVFAPKRMLGPVGNWRRNMRSCQLGRDLLSNILIQLRTASFASGDHSMLQPQHGRQWAVRLCMANSGCCPASEKLVAIDHGALPNFEKLQPENWFIAHGFDTWVYMHVL